MGNNRYFIKDGKIYFRNEFGEESQIEITGINQNYVVECIYKIMDNLFVAYLGIYKVFLNSNGEVILPFSEKCTSFLTLNDDTRISVKRLVGKASFENINRPVEIYKYGLYDIINKKWLVKPEEGYQIIHGFNSGYAAVTTCNNSQNNYAGWIDINGKVLCLEHSLAGNFTEIGIATFLNHDGSFGIIDTEGKKSFLSLPTNFGWPNLGLEFHKINNIICSYALMNDLVWVLIDINGKLIYIAPKNHYIKWDKESKKYYDLCDHKDKNGMVLSVEKKIIKI